MIIALSGLFFNINCNLRNKKIYLFIVFGCLLFVGMFRDSSIGTDLSIYYSKYFPYFKDSSWDNIQNVTISGHWEWGFCAFCKVIGYISTDVQWFIIVTSIISIVPYAIFIYRNSEDVVFSTVFYIAYHVYMNSFNIVRQAMAVGIVLLGLEQLKKKKYFKFCIFVLIASLIHTSAIIAFLFIIADRLKFKKNMIYILTLGVIVLLFGYQFIFDTLLGYTGLSDIYGMYETGVKHAAGYVTYHTLGMFVIAAIIFALTVINYSKREYELTAIPQYKKYRSININELKLKIVKHYNYNLYWSEDFIVYATYFAMVFRMMAFLINVASRMSFFFIPFLSIAFPHVIKKIESKSNKKFIAIMLYIFLIVFFLFIGFTRAGDLWGTVPYRFCWG